jgi:hypothetical protein
MTVTKPKMLASYKAIFILSIFMVFFVLLAGAITKSKSSGFGMWIWGYTAWLMYKRRVPDLVSFYKIILWFDAIAAGIIVVAFVFGNNDLGFALGDALIILGVAISITYGLYRYFKNLQLNPNSTASYDANDTSLWEQVSEEIKNGIRIDSLWTRAFSEADGDNNKANARYIKLRLDQIKNSAKSTSEVSKGSTEELLKLPPKQSKPIHTGFFLLLVAIVAYASMYFLLGSYNNTAGNVLQSTSVPTATSKSTGTNENIENCIFVWSDVQRTFTKIKEDIMDADKYTNTIIVKIGKEAYSESLFAQLRKADAEKNIPLAKSIAKEIRANALTVYFEKNLSVDYINLLATQQNLRSRCL